MRNGFLGSMTALLAGAGLAIAQTPAMSTRSAAGMSPALLAAGSPAMAAQPSQTMLSPGGPGSSTPVLGTPVICSPCAGSACCGCDSCDVGLVGRYYFGADYILMWTKGHQLPTLVTTGSQADLSAAG